MNIIYSFFFRGGFSLLNVLSLFICYFFNLVCFHFHRILFFHLSFALVLLRFSVSAFIYCYVQRIFFFVLLMLLCVSDYFHSVYQRVRIFEFSVCHGCCCKIMNNGHGIVMYKFDAWIMKANSFQWNLWRSNFQYYMFFFAFALCSLTVCCYS